MTNNLFEVVLGTPKEFKNLITYSIHQDGIMMHKKTPWGILSQKINGLPWLDKCEESINILQRKIPFNAFLTIIDFFKYVIKHHGQSFEAYAIVGYNKDEDKYCIYIPEQTVGGASVKYDIKNFSKEFPGYYIVLDIHSHPFSNSIPNFSGIDDKNDINDRLSGVVAALDDVIPKTKFRFGANGRFWNYEMTDIFERTDEVFNLDFEKEVKKISKVESSTNNGFVTSSNLMNRFSMNGNRSILDRYLSAKKDDRDFTLEELMGEDW